MFFYFIYKVLQGIPLLIRIVVLWLVFLLLFPILFSRSQPLCLIPLLIFLYSIGEKYCALSQLKNNLFLNKRQSLLQGPGLSYVASNNLECCYHGFLYFSYSVITFIWLPMQSIKPNQKRRSQRPNKNLNIPISTLELQELSEVPEGKSFREFIAI